MPDPDVLIDRFWEAHCRGDHFPLDWHDRLNFDEAYRIQIGVIERRKAWGERQVGWKVAQTSEAARRSLGFTEPVFGCVMSDGVRQSGHEYMGQELARCRCEPELCVRLREPLHGTVDVTTVRHAIDVVYPAFEVIELRGDIAAQKALAIADNAATKDIVLGSPVAFSPEMDLAGTGCRVLLNDDATAQGRGSDVMDDPLNAVIWLADKLAQFGLGLSAGDLVMTGSMTRVFQLAPGDRLRAEFDAIGTVSMSAAPVSKPSLSGSSHAR